MLTFVDFGRFFFCCWQFESIPSFVVCQLPGGQNRARNKHPPFEPGALGVGTSCSHQRQKALHLLCTNFFRCPIQFTVQFARYPPALQKSSKSGSFPVLAALGKPPELQETLRAPGTLLRTLGAHPGLQRGSVLRRCEPRHGGAVQLRLGAAGERPGGGEDLLLPGRGGTSRPGSDDMDLTVGDNWGILEVRVGRYLTAFEEARSENMDIV